MGFLDIFRRKKTADQGQDQQIEEKGYSPEQLARLDEYTMTSEAGVSVSTNTALQTSAVYAAVKVLSESVASLPCMVYRRLDSGGKERALRNPSYALLHDRPNNWQTAFEFWEMVTAMICLRGNAFLYKNKNGANQVRELLPLQPERVHVEQLPDWSLVYWISGDAGGPIGRFTTNDILHIRGMSLDGIMGVSPIAYQRNAIGMTVEAENYGARYFRNSAKPSGYLQHPQKLSQEAKERLRQEWERTHGGKNQHKTAVLEEGLAFNPVTMNNQDSQFLETRRFQIEEIARIFRVPAVLLQHADKTSTYASSEQFFLSFTKYTLMPWLRRIESAVNRNLFSPGEKHFAEFLVDALERADAKTRSEFYASALQNEWMTRNEVRERENLNRVDGGDEFRNPSINPRENNNANPESE
ncbi:MAG: phage portal protein [Desulfohalobiaceae bacterium]